MDATGVLELLIDERGAVMSVVVRQPVNILYDRQLVEAARKWRYEPARIGSRRVKFLHHVQVRVGARQQPLESRQVGGPG
jgi:TonB family protein